VKLNKCPDGSKVSLRKTLTHVEKCTHKKITELELSRNQPQTLAYLWDIFLDLYNGNPFSHVELKAWMEMYDFQLTQLEIEVVKTLTRIVANG